LERTQKSEKTVYTTLKKFFIFQTFPDLQHVKKGDLKPVPVFAPIFYLFCAISKLINLKTTWQIKKTVCFNVLKAVFLCTFQSYNLFFL
jgi:hypothetical protein